MKKIKDLDFFKIVFFGLLVLTLVFISTNFKTSELAENDSIINIANINDYQIAELERMRQELIDEGKYSVPTKEEIAHQIAELERMRQELIDDGRYSAPIIEEAEIIEED